jgi:hypothetical protein
MAHPSSGATAGLIASLAANLLLAATAQAAPATGNGSAVPALYPTQAEAERAARLYFNCTGAHRMGNQWMACAKHSTGQGSGGSQGSNASHGH